MGKTESTARNQNYDDVPWSDLNHDVVYLVMMRLGVIDFLAFSGVCKSWRSLALSNWNMFMASKPPMSISISTDVNEKECYLEDFEGRKFKTLLPNSDGRNCVGLTCGYLILFGEQTNDFWLVNPITRHQLHFHDVPFYVKASPCLGFRAILVFSASKSGWVFVIVNSFTDKVWFSIAGEGAWNHVSSPFPIIDIQAFKGKIYTLNYCQKTREQLCEMRLDPHPKLTLLETKNFPDPNIILMFVSSGENLYVMHFNPENLYDLHKLDFGEMKWVSSEKTREEYTFFSSSEIFVAYKPESWGDPWLKYGRNAEITGSWKDWFYSTANMWYFPHDCLNVNLIHE